MPEAVQRLEAAEGLVLGPAREAGPLGYGAFREIWDRFEAARA